ncbi:MAG: CvpA family protein [Proteobacteria bacterium]|nr:CvpA family protein [Pseudomonadota bacterium]MBU1712090.1 CvpA family protein [Pseudomonadota bacterium]
MNLFDIILIIILVYCFIRGIFRGLLKELSSLVGVFGGFYAAYTYYKEAGAYLKGWISNPDYINILSFLTIFVSIFLIISIIGIIIKYILKIVFLGWVDHVFGGVFGILKGILIGAVLLIVFTAFHPSDSSMIKNSRLSPYITPISDKMVMVTPKDLKNEYQTKRQDIDKTWKKIKKIIK